MTFSRRASLLIVGQLLCLPWLLLGTGAAQPQGSDTASSGVLERCRAVSHEGQKLALTADQVAHPDGVLLWNARASKPIRRLLETTEGSVSAVAFSPDGKTVAVGGGISQAPVAVFESGTGKLLGKHINHHRNVRGMSFSADGKHLAYIPRDRHQGEICLWNLADARSEVAVDVREFAGFWPPLPGDYHLQFSSDNRLLAIGSNEGQVIVWDQSKNKVIAVLGKNHHGWVSALCASPDGRWFAWANGYSRRLYLWDVVRGGEPVELRTGLTGPPRCLAFSADSKQLATGGGSYFETDGGLLPGEHPRRVLQGGQVTVWEVEHLRQRLSLFAHRREVAAVRFSPDGRTLHSYGDDRATVAWDLAAEQAQQSRPLQAYQP